MDTSKEYIELCGKAQEIQEPTKLMFSNGSFIFNESANDGDGYLLVNYLIQPRKDNNLWELEYKIEEYKTFNIWLPRQDQLQDIIIDKYKEEEFPIYVMLECMYNYEGGLGNSSEDRSLEQAWLAFVMIEKYNKQWNSETKEWEKP